VDPAPPLTYLDHAATTPLREEARSALLDWLDGPPGNPSGAHRSARAARRALDDARDVVAATFGCAPGDVVFTSGGTEADNLAVLGVLDASPGRRVLCGATEHHAVLDPVRSRGGDVVIVDALGRLGPDELAARLGPDVALVSVMLANNEVGTVNDLAAVAAAVRTATDGAAVLHTDAVAGAPWLDTSTLARSADLISVSAHKLGGPQGVGVLVVGPSVPLRARVLGGGQERDRRSGTQNVAGVVAMAAALEATARDRSDTNAAVAARRDRLVDGLVAAVGDVVETVPDRAAKVVANAHVCFAGVHQEELLFLLDRAGVCVSAASSCASGAQQHSHVLAAMGIDRAWATGAIRFSLGRTTTDAEVDRAVDVTAEAVTRLRSRRPLAVPLASPPGAHR
jgi:cysteine desulfurase